MRLPWIEPCISQCLAFISANYNTFTCSVYQITEYLSQNSSECSPTQEATSVSHSLYNCKLRLARPAALEGFTGSCSLRMPWRPTMRLLGSNPFTLVQKDRPVGSCSGCFCRVLIGRTVVCLEGTGWQPAWIRRGGDERQQLHIGSPRTGPFLV